MLRNRPSAFDIVDDRNDLDVGGRPQVALDGIALALLVALFTGVIGGIGAGPLGGVIGGLGVLAVGLLIAFVFAVDSAIGGAVGSLFS